MRRSTLRAITASMVCGTVLILSALLVLPRLVFWSLERYAQREGGLQ